MKWFIKALFASGFLTFTTPAIAAPTPAELAGASVAEKTGAEMYAYDQAAWHATDRVLDDAKAKGLSQEQLRDMGWQGYIIEPEADGKLVATFYGVKSASSFAIARYVVSGNSVVNGGFVETPGEKPLSPLALRMIAARNKAIKAIADAKYGLCSGSPANSLVLPPRSDGTLPVYILTSTEDWNIYPAGGHFRFDFDKDGNLVSQRRFMNSCFPIDLRPKDGIRPELMVLTHSLDGQPTEIHAFVSLNIPISLVVITVGNRSEWAISHGHIQYAQDVPLK
ncbi:MAG: hypothetical protein ABI673_11380 [Novosphingobium sp.]